MAHSQPDFAKEGRKLDQVAKAAETADKSPAAGPLPKEVYKDPDSDEDEANALNFG